MDSEKIDRILSRANELLDAGKPAESLSALDALDGRLVDTDDRIEFATLRAWALSELDRVDDALRAVEPLLDEFPESARLHGTRGVVLSNADELDEACEALERAVELDPRDDVALANLALVYERVGELEQAIRLYDKAMRLGADIDWALQRKAAVLGEMGDYPAAKATLKRYLSLAPEDIGQWISLAIMHSDDEEYADAFHCYEVAERIDGDAPLLRLNWGVTAVRAGDLKLANRQLRALQRLTPQAPQPRLLRALIEEEEQNLTAAAASYADALRVALPGDPGDLAYALELAMDFHSRQDHLDECERLLALGYAHNACTVELCEAYREATGERLDVATWFSIDIEADYREGLAQHPRRRVDSSEQPTRFSRNVQVVARDRDDALAFLIEFLERMGETHVRIREFAADETMKDVFTGIYEVDPECMVLVPGRR